MADEGKNQTKNKKKKSGKKKDSELTLCRHKVVHELRKTVLEIDCEGCKEEGAIDNPLCRKGIMTALKMNPNVDSIITSHYREIQYVAKSMEIMESMRKFMEVIDKMSIRDPYMEFFGQSDTKKKEHNIGICESCQIYPESILSGVKEGIINDFNKAYESFAHMTSLAQNFHPHKPECRKCHNILSQDMVYLFNQMEGLRTLILLRGFQIVI